MGMERCKMKSCREMKTQKMHSDKARGVCEGSVQGVEAEVHSPEDTEGHQADCEGGRLQAPLTQACLH